LKAVQKALASGRIAALENGRIDARAADQAWAVNTDPGRRPTCADSPSPARTERERYLALLTRLEYEERAGLLAPVSQVEKIAFELGRGTRDRVLAVTGRLASVVASISDEAEVVRLLDAELRTALELLEDEKLSQVLPGA
jgi:hypothetical protein